MERQEIEVLKNDVLEECGCVENLVCSKWLNDLMDKLELGYITKDEFIHALKKELM